MSHYYEIPLFDAAALAETRRVTGPSYPRIVSYFQEDGVKAIVAIEQAMHMQSAAALVLPAHTLKGESRQLGAARLAEIAETIEMTARACMEKQLPPDGLAAEVAMLRGCFSETLQQLAPAAGGAAIFSPAEFSAPARTVQPGGRPASGRAVIFGRRTS